MSDQKANDKSEHLPKAPDMVLQNADAQDARNSGKAEIVSAEKLRTNQSDGSLRRYSGLDLSDQDQSIEITYGEKSTSKTNKLTEAELLQSQRKAALEAQSQTIEEMRQAVKTTPALEPVLALREYSQSMLPGEDKDKYRDLALLQAKEVSPDMAASIRRREENTTSAGAGEMLKGGVSENHWGSELEQAFGELGKLPLDKQVSVLAAGFSAGFEHDENERSWGRLIGSVEGIGAALTSVATVVDFGGAILWNDKKVAGEIAEKFGKDLATATFEGIRLYAAADKCLFDTGASGDYTLPFRQIAATGAALNEQWAALPPREQERIKYMLITECAADAAMGAGGAQAIGKAKTFTGVLDAMAEHAIKIGPGAFERSKKALASSIQEFLTPDYAYEGIGRLKVLQETRDESTGLFVNEHRKYKGHDGFEHTAGQAANLAGISNEEFKKLGFLEKAQELVKRGFEPVDIRVYHTSGCDKPLTEAAMAKQLKLTKRDLRQLTDAQLESHGVTAIEPTNGRLPLNWQWAGKYYPFAEKQQKAFTELISEYPSFANDLKRGVRFTEKGYPDFRPFEIENKWLQKFVDRDTDFYAADKLVWPFIDSAAQGKALRKKYGLTWHHNEDGHSMQLLPLKLHESVAHTGGIAKR